MKRFLAVILSLFVLGRVSGQPQEATQSPHGPDMKRDCRMCHLTKDWTVQNENVQFNHRETKFPLTEAHMNVRCRSCHRDLNFTRVGTSCSDCHTDFHQGRMGKDCAYCHTAGNWEDRRKVRENHTRLLFPLIGAHAAVECEACHGTAQRLQFSNTSTGCVSCHREAYDRTTDPDHRKAGFSTECTQCHSQTAVTWKGAAFRHPGSFPLEQGHANLKCGDCHKQTYAGTPMDCFACHETDYKRALEPNHPTAQFPLTCTLCHNTTAWKPSSYNHDQTAFSLKGAHRTLACASCHKDNRYAGTPRDCYACHEKDFMLAANPNHTANQFDRDCLKCHTQSAWKPSTFNHAQTGFPLAGAHTRVQCSSCHTAGYGPMPADCYTCHKTNYNAVMDPGHAAGNFDRDCLKCHTQTAWKPATFDHNKTGFPLTGAHQPLNCSACHQKGFAGTPRDCYACHEKDFMLAANPNHSSNQFDRDCLKCHTQSAWKPSTFNHAQTGFPLAGAHTRVQCSACHTAGYGPMPADCYTCHKTNYNAVMDPGHAAGNFDRDCLKCHTQTAWKPSTFNHAQTGFPLAGAHTRVQCSACHTAGYGPMPADCYTCHKTNYNAVMDPGHAAGNFDRDCLKCHTQTAWKPATFDHNKTGFPLTGAHQPLNCSACHQKGFVGTPKDCFACHETNYKQAQGPNHLAAQFPLTCTLCHNTAAWKPSSYNHDQTAFSLKGAHRTLACASCHKDNRYAGTPRDCYACHEKDFMLAANPNHTANQFDRDCLKCHTQSAWKPSTFNHAQTGFPLAGAHTRVQCSSCHTAGYGPMPADCYTCHKTNYNAVMDPGHAAGNFDRDCLKCHTQTAWKPATFDHNKTGFPLTGAHQPLNCSACHQKGFVGTPKDCIFCHQADYDGTSNPNHRAAGFSLNCLNCHNTTRWQGAQFNHDQSFFPIYSGKHSGRWNACTDCHPNASSYAVFTCTNCHTRRSTDEDHDEVSGYRYNSSDCYRCHPRGSH